MAENNRDQDQGSGSKQQSQDSNPGNQKPTTSGRNEQDQNPQSGTKWSNYQTREMSDEGYRNEGSSQQSE